MFDTATGISSLILKEIPCKQTAYVHVGSVEEGGLGEHLSECVSFAGMCGAEKVYATGHEDLAQWPKHCAVLTMAMLLP